MITILTMLEAGYESTYEHLAFKQLSYAMQTNLTSIPHDYATFQEGLDAATGTRIFMTPPGRVAHSTEFKDWTPPAGDLVFCFGSPQNDMTSYITPTCIALHISKTKNDSLLLPADMMAVCVAGIVVYGHR